MSIPYANKVIGHLTLARPVLDVESAVALLRAEARKCCLTLAQTGEPDAWIDMRMAFMGFDITSEVREEAVRRVIEELRVRGWSAEEDVFGLLEISVLSSS